MFDYHDGAPGPTIPLYQHPSLYFPTRPRTENNSRVRTLVLKVSKECVVYGQLD